MFRDSQIVIITNFVVVSGVGIKRVVCTYNGKYGIQTENALNNRYTYAHSALQLTTVLTRRLIRVHTVCHASRQYEGHSNKTETGLISLELKIG